jgi:allophanate hydrolase subunit 2
VVLTNLYSVIIVLTGEMMRKGYLVVAVLAAGTLLAAAQSDTGSKIAFAAQNFEQRFEDLKDAGTSLNVVERLVFSLALASATPAAEK